MKLNTILIAGGTGYVGSKMCKLAQQRGLKVISLTRRGRPANPLPGVEYIKGDAISPETYETVLGDCRGAIYSVGELIGYQEDVLIRNVLPVVCRQMCRQADKDKINSVLHDNSFAKKNRDAAIKLAKALGKFGSKKKKLPFVFMSAHMNPIFNFVKPDYFGTKYETEKVLQSIPNIAPIILRPGLITTPESLIRTAIGIPAQYFAGRNDLTQLVNFALDSMNDSSRHDKTFETHQIV
eukprot:178984_1